MNIKQIIKITGIISLGFSLSTCHPWQWEDLPRVNPECPAVDSLSPSGAPFDAIVTVYGTGYDAKNIDQFTLIVNGEVVPIKDMQDSTSLRFQVTREMSSGEIKVSRGGNACGASKQFIYYYTVMASPTVFAGVEGDFNCSDCLFGPGGMDVDQNGNVYIADKEHHVIQRITPNGEMAIIAGQKNINDYDDNPFIGLGATFANPSDVAFDPSGNLFVADEGNNRIRKIGPADPWPVSWVSGSGSIGGTNGKIGGATTTYNSPTGIACDKKGNVYVAESSGHRLRLLDFNTDLVTALAGNGTPSLTDLSRPTGVDCLPETNASKPSVYVANSNNKLVRAYNLTGVGIKVPDVVQ